MQSYKYPFISQKKSIPPPPNPAFQIKEQHMPGFFFAQRMAGIKPLFIAFVVLRVDVWRVLVVVKESILALGNADEPHGHFHLLCIFFGISAMRMLA